VAMPLIYGETYPRNILQSQFSGDGQKLDSASACGLAQNMGRISGGG
jgi:hypothetical protein